MTKRTQRPCAKNVASCLAAFSVLLSSGVAAATSGVISLTPGNWYMVEDHYGTLTLGSNTNLDCRGYALYNPGDQDPVCWDEDGGPFRCGIYIEGDYVQIQNCVVRWYDQGITVYNGYQVSITGSRLADNADGAHFAYAGGYTSGDLYAGGNDISWNTGEGINLYSLYGFRASGNVIWWNDVDGVDGDSTYLTTIDSNSLIENGDHAIELDYGSDHNISANYIDGRDDNYRYKTQARDGIQLEETTNFNIESNTVYDAGRHGIYLHNASTGTVHHNTASGSISGYDCRKNGGSSVTYHGNTFGTVSGCSR